jgi:YjbE family integral membrane protein
MFDWLSAAELTSFLSVIAIDIALAGDNAIVVGMAAAGLPLLQRRRAILLGIVAAAVMRIAFAFFATQLLDIIGLLLAGGILLLWVSWKLWRELRQGHHEEPRAVEALEDAIGSDGKLVAKPPAKTFKQAVTQIVIADLSMSLDNVLAVAGAAREHPWVLIFGLALSVALMGIAANFIARLLQRHHWIAYIGLLVIVYVSIKMIWEGWLEVAHVL